MSDFIVLQCPNCGGSLEVGSNTLSLRCEHCGVEHLVRQEDEGVMLESFARCPKCNRNDRAEKVSAILRTQKQNIEGVSYQTQTTFVKIGDNYRPRTENVAVPIRSTQMSDLAKQLVPPAKPVQPHFSQPSSANLLLLSIAIILFLGMGLCLFTAAVLGFTGVISIDPADYGAALIMSACFLFPAVVMAAIGIWLWRVQIPKVKSGNLERKDQIEQEKLTLQTQYENSVARWQKAMIRWDNLYYCGRDDCVFIPGDTKSAPLNELQKYLFS